MDKARFPGIIIPHAKAWGYEQEFISFPNSINRLFKPLLRIETEKRNIRPADASLKGSKETERNRIISTLFSTLRPFRQHHYTSTRQHLVKSFQYLLDRIKIRNLGCIFQNLGVANNTCFIDDKSRTFGNAFQV